jgi:flagellar basal-body rod protein FlgB
MTTQNIGLFKALSAKMSWLNQRHNVISQNIANADTPHYRPNDLKPVDFGVILGEETGRANVNPVTTHPDHMPDPTKIAEGRTGKQEGAYEVAPAGNSVILEEQLITANRNAMDYRMVTNLYQKNVSMYRVALGRNG